MGLDKTGLSTPSYAQLLSQYTAKGKQLFGDDFQVDENSVFGIYVRVIGWVNALIYQDIQYTYLANYLDQATGISLDRLGNNFSVSRNPAQAATVSLTFTGTPGYVIHGAEDSTIYSTVDDIEFNLVDDVTIGPNGTGIGEAVCSVKDSTGNVPANSIIVAVEPDENVTAVTNLVQASGGTEQETDTDFRKRIKLTLQSQAGPTLKGLYTALYDLPAVEQVQIVENNTMETDNDGNPPKSLHFFVRGGNQQEVGQAILDNMGAGMLTIGGIEVTATDIGGHFHQVNFDTATQVPLYLSITLKTTVDFNPETSPDEIQQAIKDYLATVIMGGNVVFTKLYQAIYNVDGVTYAEVKLGRDSSALGTTDIQLDKFESAEIAKDGDITIEVSANE